MNAAIRKSLRPYQACLIADVCRADGPVLVEQPTGSGKTMQIVTLVAMKLGQRFPHAVIAVPPKMYNALTWMGRPIQTYLMGTNR